jgi:hypothetical protein
VQPTDVNVRSVFVSLGHEGREEVHRGTRVKRQGLVVRKRTTVSTEMNLRLIRLIAALGAVIAVALAGGASLTAL